MAASSSGSGGTPLGGRGSRSPSSTSLTQLPRRMGLVRDAPDCLASVVAWARMPPREYVFTPSTRRHSAAGHAGDAVVLGQRIIQERVVGVEDVEHRAVVLKQVGEELNRLLVHRAAQADERGEVPLALFVEWSKSWMCSHWQANSVASRRVLASCSIRRVWAASTLGVAQPSRRGQLPQFVIGLRRPQEVAQPAGQFPVGDRTLPRAGPGFSTRYRNAGATSTRASVRRKASSWGISCFAQIAHRALASPVPRRAVSGRR